MMNDTIETDDFNKKVEEVEERHNSDCISSRQVFKKFKDKEKFITPVNKLGIHKTTVIFKINVFKLCENHSKLLKSSIGLGYFKTHYKDIQEICNENEQEFS